jgi:hypothetical protein
MHKKFVDLVDAAFNTGVWTARSIKAARNLTDLPPGGSYHSTER